jgi:hypothetical protein
VTDAVYVPDLWRGTIPDFFTWLATNNGAQRKVRANFKDSRLQYALQLWSTQNPALFNKTPF